jgi:polyisoprenoid-binding protein YceI
MSGSDSIPGYVAGTWAIDSGHSEVGFTVRHMMVSKVRGSFAKVEGTITTAEDPTDSSATAVIDFASITTHNEERDAHLRGADFFDVDAEGHADMTFRSTAVRPAGKHYTVDGDLTIRRVTRPVTLDVEVGGVTPDPYGNTRIGLSATGEISRSDYGITWNAALEGGGVVVADKVQLNLEIEAVLEK